MITPRIIPRIIPRDQIAGSMRVAQATSGERTCGRRISLDGRLYRCGREVSFDRQHDGIHDAFCEHCDGGSVRW